MEQPDEDSLHYSQSKYKSYLQKPDLEYKDLNLLQDVSCWSETQQSKLSCPLSKSAIVQNAINDESKPTEYRIENKQDDKEEKSNQNKLKPQEEQCLVEIQQYDSNRNIKSKTYGGDQSGKNIDTDKSKLTTFSLRKQQTLNGQKPIINNSSFKNRNITNSITFMMKLKQKITYYQKVLTLPGRSKYVTETIKDYINDKSDSSHNRAQNWLLKCNLIQNIYNYLQSLNLPLIDCQSKIGIGLSFFFITYNCIFLLLLSLFTVFNGLQSRMEILNSITFFLWIIELIVKLNTSFFLKEKLIKQREDIILHYLQKKICIDLIPIIVIINSTHKIILIIVFIKTINIVSDISQFQKYLCMVVRKYYFVILINLVIKMFTFAHIIACMWFGIALIEINYMNISSWIEDGTDFENDWWKIYIQSLYWALTLMTTGSNVATTILQLMFTTFIMIFTTIAFGYLLNIVGFVLETIDKQDEQKRSDINVINEYMRQKKISYQNMNKLQQESEEILDKLSLDLKISLAKEFNRKIINKIEIFTKNFSNTTLDLLCFACVEEFYLPNQIIYSDNHKSEPSLIYVISGQIELVYLDQLDQSYSTQYINSQIKEGQICGQLELFTGMSQQRYFRSTEYCQILRITHKDFVELVRKDQKDFEKFCQIRDNVLVYESFSSLSVPCEICNYSTHQVFNCPMIHLQKNFMIQKIGISQKQQQNRQYQDRQQTHKTKKAVTENNPAHQQFIQEHLFQQQINSNNEIEYEFSEMTDQEQSEQENQTATQLTIDEQGKIFKIEEGQPVEMKNDKRKSVQIQQITIPMAKMQQGGYRQSILQQVEEIAQKGEDLSNIQDLKGMSKRKQSILSKKMEFNFDVQQISETVSKIRNSEGDCFQVLLSPSKKQSFIYLSNYQSQLNNSQDFEEKSNPSRRKERNKTRQFTRTGNSHLTQILKIQQMGNLNQNKQQEDELENPWNFEKLQDYKFYFTKGNSKNYLIRYNKFYNKKFKEILKKQFKK